MPCSLADTKVKTDHELRTQRGDSVRWQTVILLSGLVGIGSAIVSAAQESTPQSSQQDRWDAACRDGSLKVLFIGNSQMQCYDLPQMIKVMSESAPAGSPRIAVGRALLAEGD